MATFILCAEARIRETLAIFPSERRGLAAIVLFFISRDTCSDSIAKLYRARFCGRAPKERRRRRAEKRLSKRVFLKSPLLLCPLKVCSLNTRKTLRGQRRNRLSKNTLLDNRFSARRLLRSFDPLSFCGVSHNYRAISCKMRYRTLLLLRNPAFYRGFRFPNLGFPLTAVVVL